MLVDERKFSYQKLFCFTKTAMTRKFNQIDRHRHFGTLDSGCSKNLFTASDTSVHEFPEMNTPKHTHHILWTFLD